MSADDVIAIQNLLADYNHCIDGGDADGWADLFAEGGSLDTGMQPPVSGRAALADFVRDANKVVPGARHIVTNITVTVAGSSATSRSYLQLWVPGEGGMKLMMSGRYTDTLTKTAAGWRFATRTMNAD